MPFRFVKLHSMLWWDFLTTFTLYRLSLTEAMGLSTNATASESLELYSAGFG